MTKSVAARVGLGAVLFLALTWCWYAVAADYSYRAVAGTYIFRSNAESSTLFLGRDQRFQQNLSRDGKVEHAQGTWRRIGEGGCVLKG